MPEQRTRARRRPIGDAGISTVEFVLVAPLLMLFSIFLVALGLIVRSHTSLDAAARDAARAASLTRTPSAANAAARQAAQASGGRFCRGGVVHVDPIDPASFVAGGIVRVHISCNVPALQALGFEWSTYVDATSAAPLDLYRRTA